jgi:hypothetical protein
VLNTQYLGIYISFLTKAKVLELKGFLKKLFLGQVGSNYLIGHILYSMYKYEFFKIIISISVKLKSIVQALIVGQLNETINSDNSFFYLLQAE